jgi:hypothetical protein
MSKDEVRLREALRHISAQIDPEYSSIASIADRLPHVIRFIDDILEGGKRPGFDEFIKNKLECLNLSNPMNVE